MPKLSLRLCLAAVLLLLTARSACPSDGDYDKGVAYLRAGRAEEALRLLEPLSASMADDPYLHYHIALADYRLERYDQAFFEFQKAEELSKGAGSNLNLGAAYTNLGVGYFRKKEFGRAEACFQRAVSLDPGDGDGHYYLGLAKTERRDFGGALAEFEKARELKAGDAKAAAAVRNAEGVAYYKQESYSQALAAFNKTLDADPDNVEALYYLGLVNYKEDGFAAAKPYFDRILKRGAADERTKNLFFTTFFNMGVDFQNRDKAEFAAEMFEKASALRPDDADAHFYRGYNLAALDRYEEAVGEFRRALSLRPGMARAKAQLDVAGKFAAESILRQAAEQMEKGAYHGAASSYARAVEFDPESPDGKRGLGEARAALARDTKERVGRIKACLSRDEYARAREELDGLSKSNPGSSESAAMKKEVDSRFAMAVDELTLSAKDALGREALGEAAASYEKLLGIDPGNEGAKEALAKARGRIADERGKAETALAQGRLLAARKGYQRLVKFTPGDPDAGKGLADVEKAIADNIAGYTEKAQAALSGDDFPKAAGFVEKTLELDPENADALALRRRIAARAQELVAKDVKEGEVYLRRGRRDMAADSFRSALAIDPDNSVARAGLANALAPPPAPAAPAAASPAPPSAPTASSGYEGDDVRKLYLAGVEHYMKGELKEAIGKWREVLKLDPGNEKATSSINKAEEKLREAAGR